MAESADDCKGFLMLAIRVFVVMEEGENVINKVILTYRSSQLSG